MRRLAARLILACVLCCPGASLAATASDAVVQLMVAADGNRGRIGTGFFWSERGQVITAYHVVVGARSIRVVDASGRASLDVVVTHIQPDADLALLEVRGLPAPNAFIRFTGRAPTIADELRTVGSPRGIAQQTFVGRTTSERLVSSSQLLDDRGRRIFREDLLPVDILPLDMTIYTGMSGGPLLLNGEAVGVLVASLNEGGAFAWGIPVKYVGAERWILVNNRPDRIQWPEFRLLSQGSRSLEALVSYSASEAALVEAYFSQGQQLENVLAGATNAYSGCQVASETLIRLEASGARPEVMGLVEGEVTTCLQAFLKYFEQIAAIEDRISITHEQVSVAVARRKPPEVVRTELVRLGSAFPSIQHESVARKLQQEILLMGQVNPADRRAVATATKRFLDVLDLDSPASHRRIGTILQDIRLISVYFNQLVLRP